MSSRAIDAPALRVGALGVDLWRLAPALLAAAVAGAYLIAGIRTGDLAAHDFRADLFAREGLTIWNGNWYGGHHTPAYGVLFPALASVFGAHLVGAVSAVASAALFEPLVRRHFGPTARWGALWFGLAATSLLFTGRLAFALGVAVGLGSLLALQRGRILAAAALAAACSLASPVAGLFLALGCSAHALARRRERAARTSLAVAAAALVPPALLALAFPEGGEQPFPLTTYLPIAGFAAACVALLPARERSLRIGAALYGLVATAAFVVPTPLGTNSERLAVLFGGPVLLCALARSPRRAWRIGACAAVLPALAWWQLEPAVGHVVSLPGVNPAGEARYYRPLLAFLDSAGASAGRVEIPFTNTHREADDVAARFPLARGWERQLDVERNALFYDGPVGFARYRRWLEENGVHWVALPTAKQDYSSRAEVALIRRGPPYLRLRWRNLYWRVFEVVPRPPLVVAEGGARITLVRLGSDEVALSVRRPGAAVVRVRFTPYWRARGACVERAGKWTRVIAERPGPLRMTTSFSPERVVSRGRRCA